ncbi:MAG: hypothetical protein VYE16_05200, partial [Cyanobacteriota bacterium]|nr:hypothetical protein [Cyanobacteriota bacterium]
MRHLKPIALASSLLALCSALMPLLGRAADAVPLSTRLQQALNTPGGEALRGLLTDEYESDLESRLRIFSATFPDARWSVRPAEPLKDGQPTFEV